MNAYVLDTSGAVAWYLGTVFISLCLSRGFLLITAKKQPTPGWPDLVIISSRYAEPVIEIMAD